ncbi:DUF5659 domain-containing protein [Clostridium celatum]|uniref:DUF5659 domain-containing protein n=1 Tax=Clostridium celatum DSM 1785 TaxID=545697 RepID=L1QFV3_9CLOT|nr:DUF5659 domain-containing protein [Clostridium celatum]EKY26575.1 hypothetical protein HMPREF0216_01760 [Clostridium celatum DSM 1785]
MKKWYIIKTFKMCRYLQEKGFEIIKIMPNKENPKWNVFAFEDSNELRQAMEQYKK